VGCSSVLDGGGGGGGLSIDWGSDREENASIFAAFFGSANALSTDGRLVEDFDTLTCMDDDGVVSARGDVVAGRGAFDPGGGACDSVGRGAGVGAGDSVDESATTESCTLGLSLTGEANSSDD
jgi:hypothetical protein